MEGLKEKIRELSELKAKLEEKLTQYPVCDLCGKNVKEVFSVEIEKALSWGISNYQYNVGPDCLRQFAKVGSQGFRG